MTLCTDWDYGSSRSPEQWVQGKTRQSPIDIDTGNLQKGEDRKLRFQYEKTDVKFVLKSPKLELNPKDDGSWGGLEVDGRQWTLVSIHAHAPGEHSVDGELYPGEVHFVHKPKGKKTQQEPTEELLVVGLFLAPDGDSDLPFIGYLQTGSEYRYTNKGLELVPGEKFDPKTLLPKDCSTYYSYHGSLTTPECDEIVEFILMKNPVSVSAKSLEDFDELFPAGTNRPVQPTFDRPVFLHG